MDVIQHSQELITRREYVPFLAYGKALKQNVNLGTKMGFYSMGQTICEMLNVEPIINGESFLKEIVK